MRHQLVFPLLPMMLLLFFSIEISAGIDESPERQPCRRGKNAPAFQGWMWSPNSRVKVFTVADHFKGEDVAIVRQSLHSWSVLADATGSRVSFSYEGTSNHVQNCDNCLTLMRGSIGRSNHAAQLEAVGLVNPHVIMHAKILVDSKIKDLKELSNALAHEIGHSFGLTDCYTCQAQTTVMNAVNSSRGRDAPSECDIAQVKRAYQLLDEQTQRAKRQAKWSEDEGEEPIEDDTPIITEPR